MHGRGRKRRPRMLHELSALFRNAIVRPENCLRRRSSQTNNNFRVDRRNLSLQPRLACTRFRRTWLLVDTPLPALVELEVLHGIRHIDVRPVDSGFFEGAIDQASSGNIELPLAKPGSSFSPVEIPSFCAILRSNKASRTPLATTLWSIKDLDR